MTPRAMMLAATLMLGAALPVAAQAVPPPPPAANAPPAMQHGMDRMHGKMFASMSEAGRSTMMEAMKGGDDREATRAARDRVLDVVDADRLDMAALKRAMDAEREAATAARVRRQTSLLAALQQLSAADRKAFVADARAMRGRMEGKMKGGHDRHGGRGAGEMPPPPM